MVLLTAAGLVAVAMGTGALIGLIATRFRKPRRTRVNLSHLSRYFVV